MYCLALFACLIASMQCIDPAVIVDGLIPKDNPRHQTVVKALGLMEERGHKIIVETGTARGGVYGCGGDGCSTVMFSRWAQLHPEMFVFSVDIDQHNCAAAQEAVRSFNRTRVFHDDSLHFLASFPTQIDFLYLDSFDYDSGRQWESQEHHLKEIVAAYNKLHEHSVVMVDECDLPGGGKCLLVERFLKDLGWKVVLRGYQVIMVMDPAAIL